MAHAPVSFRKFVFLPVLDLHSRRHVRSSTLSKFFSSSSPSHVGAVIARCSSLDGIRTRTFANISPPCARRSYQIPVAATIVVRVRKHGDRGFWRNESQREQHASLFLKLYEGVGAISGTVTRDGYR